ncbi:MAG: beta-lactamase class A, partial [Saprospiraceae bacterium]
MKYGIRFLAILTLIIGLNYTKTDSTAALKTAINQLSNDPAMSAGQLGVCIMDTKTGEIISSYNSGKA